MKACTCFKDWAAPRVCVCVWPGPRCPACCPSCRACAHKCPLRLLDACRHAAARIPAWRPVPARHVSLCWRGLARAVCVHFNSRMNLGGARRAAHGRAAARTCRRQVRGCVLAPLLGYPALPLLPPVAPSLSPQEPLPLCLLPACRYAASRYRVLEAPSLCRGGLSSPTSSPASS